MTDDWWSELKWWESSPIVDDGSNICKFIDFDRLERKYDVFVRKYYKDPVTRYESIIVEKSKYLERYVLFIYGSNLEIWLRFWNWWYRKHDFAD